MNGQRVRVLAGVGLVVTLAIGPAARPTPTTAAGTFVWHDLVTDNGDASRAFYGELFGWTFEPGDGVDPGYTVIRHNGLPIGGMVVPRQPTSPQWLSYVVVEDVDAAAAAFRAAGGQIFRGPLNARNNLRVAAVADPQGAAIGLANRGPAGGIADGVPDVHRWLWMDYVAHDATPAIEFYRRVLGYRADVADTQENATYYLLANDRPRAGLFASPWPRETSLWLPYVRVADPAASAVRARELGGTIVQAPSERLRHYSLAIVLDPAGAPLALQKYPFDRGVKP